MRASGSRGRRAALVVTVAAGMLLGGCARSATDGDLAVALADLPRARVTVGDDPHRLVIDAYVADTPATRARGLQGITVVPEGAGMLFVLDGPRGSGARPGFWMLDTLVPLDIAFAADGVVVGVATMTPCPAAPCPITHPGVEYDVALEVGAGVLTRAGVVPGDPFVWDAGSTG